MTGIKRKIVRQLKKSEFEQLEVKNMTEPLAKTEFAPAIIESHGFIDGRTLIISLLKIWTVYVVAVFFILLIYISTVGLSASSIFSTDVLRGVFSIFAYTIASALWTQMLLGACLIGATYLTFINIFKRVRDIRGVTTNEFVWKAATIALCIAPTFSFLFLAFLFVKEGKLSSPATAISIDEIFRVR